MVDEDVKFVFGETSDIDVANFEGCAVIEGGRGSWMLVGWGVAGER